MNAPSQVGISSSLDHSTASLKKTSIKTTRQRVNINPTNGSVFSPDSTIKISLPRRGFLSGKSSYLKFDVNVLTDASATQGFIDNTASSFISRLEVFHSGALQESIERYNVLSVLLNDICYGPDDLQGLTSAYAGADGIDASGNTKAYVRGGRFVSAGANSTATYTFCIPILSSLFMLQDKSFPLGLLSSELEVQFTLCSKNEPWYLTLARDWTLSNVQLVAEIVEPADMASIRSLYPETIVIPTTSYRTYISSIVAAGGVATSYSIQLPFKGSSAKSLLLISRNKVGTGVTDYNVSSRQHFISSMQLKIGGLAYPSLPIKGTATEVAEFAIELKKAFHALSATGSCNGMISRNLYKTGAGATGASSWGNAGAYGLDLDSFHQRSDVLMSGVDLSAVTTFIDIVTLTDAIASEIDMFVMHDALQYITPDGQMATRF
jgi:hypothetical protein